MIIEINNNKINEFLKINKYINIEECLIQYIDIYTLLSSHENKYKIIRGEYGTIETQTDYDIIHLTKEHNTQTEYTETPEQLIYKEAVNVNMTTINTLQTRYDSLLQASTSHTEKLLNKTIEQALNKITTKIDEYDQYATKFRSSSNFKGKENEKMYLHKFNEVFINYTIDNVSKETNTGDFILSRDDKPSILIDVKYYEGSNVPSLEVEKFIKIIYTKKMCGMLITNNGIANKDKGIELDFIDGYPVIYLSNFDCTEMSLIKTLVKLLYSLVRIKKQDDESTISIHKNVFDELVEEYLESVKNINEIIDGLELSKRGIQDTITKLKIKGHKKLRNFLCILSSHETKMTCQVLLQKGKRKNEVCGKTCNPPHNKCSQHI